MRLKATARRFVGAIGRWPLVSPLVRHPAVRGVLTRLPGARALYGNGWDRIHPYDRAHGTDTSGFISADELPASEPARAHAVYYAGSQPSVVRAALAALPPVDASTFIDLGCGKGRVLLVASELPFRDILGVELSLPLAEICRRNAALMASRHPHRTPIRVAVGDASRFAFPAGDLVLFLSHPFGAEIVAKVVAALEAALAAQTRSVHVAYYNPIAGHCFDASPALRRHFAGTITHAEEERGYAPDDDDPLVIWQGGTAAPPATAASATIVVRGGTRVELQGATAGDLVPVIRGASHRKAPSAPVRWMSEAGGGARAIPGGPT